MPLEFIPGNSPGTYKKWKVRTTTNSLLGWIMWFPNEEPTLTTAPSSYALSLTQLIEIAAFMKSL